MELDFAVLADGVSLDPDGKITLVGLGVDAVVAQSVPAVHPRLVVAVRVWASEDEAREEHRVDVEVFAPDGERVGATHSLTVPMTDEQLELARSVPLAGVGIAAVLDTRGLPMPAFGRYEIAIKWDGEPLRSLPIALVKPPSAGPA